MWSNEAVEWSRSMPNFTQNAIKQAFIKLLDERPLKQITVKDIVEECGINRNSFSIILHIFRRWPKRSSWTK